MITLYIEGISASTQIGGATIKLMVDPTGTGAFASPIISTVSTTVVDTKVLIGAESPTNATDLTDWVAPSDPTTTPAHENAIYNWVTVTGPANTTVPLSIRWQGRRGGGFIDLEGLGNSPWKTPQGRGSFSSTVTIGDNGSGSFPFLIYGGTVSKTLDDVAVTASYTVGATPGSEPMSMGKQTLTVLQFNYVSQVGVFAKPISTMAQGNFLVNPAYHSGVSDVFAFDAGLSDSGTDTASYHNGTLFAGTMPELDSPTNGGPLKPLGRKFDVSNIVVSYFRTISVPSVPSFFGQTATLGSGGGSAL